MLVGDLTVLPEDPTVSTAPLPAEVAGWGREVARRLAETTARVARDTGVRHVDVPHRSRGHHAWAAEPWTRRFHLWSLAGLLATTAAVARRRAVRPGRLRPRGPRRRRFETG